MTNRRIHVFREQVATLLGDFVAIQKSPVYNLSAASQNSLNECAKQETLAFRQKRALSLGSADKSAMGRRGIRNQNGNEETTSTPLRDDPLRASAPAKIEGKSRRFFPRLSWRVHRDDPTRGDDSTIAASTTSVNQCPAIAEESDEQTMSSDKLEISTQKAHHHHQKQQNCTTLRLG